MGQSKSRGGCFEVEKVIADNPVSGRRDADAAHALSRPHQNDCVPQEHE